MVIKSRVSAAALGLIRESTTHRFITWLRIRPSRVTGRTKVAEHEIIINLTGKSIFTYWTEKVKKELYDSRILTTRHLAQSLAGAKDTIFFSTSAVGYYGERGEDVLTESEPPGNDFLATVCKDWEAEALKAQTDSIRVVLARFGIVLDRSGGAMGSMLPAFKFFLGGRLGSGRQWFPWIHLHDLIEAYRFAINHPDCCRSRQLVCTGTGAQPGYDPDPGAKAQPPGYVADPRICYENSAWRIWRSPDLQPAGAAGSPDRRGFFLHLWHHRQCPD